LLHEDKNVSCSQCGSIRALKYHHITYNPEKVIVLCTRCHTKLHKNTDLPRPKNFNPKIKSPCSTSANRISIGFSDEQFDFLCEQVRKGKAEGIAQIIRGLVNDSMSCVQTDGDKK
jgi:hypothetical protein